MSTTTTKPNPLHGHQGFTSPRYKRAQRTTDALLRSGRRLLRKRPLDSVSIQELCARAHVTTGAFYGRFDSKEVFFKALQALALEDMRAAIHKRVQEMSTLALAPHQHIHMLARNLRRQMLRHEGVMRATLLQHSDGAMSWAPFRALAHDYVEQLVPFIARLHAGPADPAQGLRIRFGFQMLVGTIVNAAINNPGPLALSNARMDEELTRMMCAYLEIPGGA